MSEIFTTASALVVETPMIVINQDGTPIGPLEDLFDDTTRIFGLVKGVSTEWAGPFSPLVILSITAFLIIAFVRIVTFLLPLLAAIIRFIFSLARGIIGIIK